MPQSDPVYPNPSSPVVIVDDEKQFLLSASVMLRAAGIEPVEGISDSRRLLPYLGGSDAAVIVLDLLMPHQSGTELLPRILEARPQVPVIVITGLMDVDAAVACMKSGAFDFLTKPVEPGRFLSSVRRALERRALERDVLSLQARCPSHRSGEQVFFHGIVTRNRGMKAVLDYVEAVADSPHLVLITGEAGVGKELIARALHARSGRSGAFIAVNVAGLDDVVFSDTLFGHRKGAFPEADHDGKGLLAYACCGTLFLDGIGDLETRSQVKLLRLLEETEYYPLGSDRPETSNARIVCATRQELPALVSAGTFRNDLFYRLHAHSVRVPPLRERLDDLPLLVDQCLDAAAGALRKEKPTPSPELHGLLSAYHFPGNVGELRAMVFDAMSRHRSGALGLETFRRAIGRSRTRERLDGRVAGPGTSGGGGTPGRVVA